MADESWDIENFDKDKLPSFIHKQVEALQSDDVPAENSLPITIAAYLDTIGLKWLLDLLFEKLQVFLLHISQEFNNNIDNDNNTHYHNKNTNNITDNKITNKKSLKIDKSIPLIYLELLQFALVIEGLDRKTEDIKLKKNIFFNLLVTQQEM